jgi:hypothetical protein
MIVQILSKTDENECKHLAQIRIFNNPTYPHPNQPQHLSSTKLDNYTRFKTNLNIGEYTVVLLLVLGLAEFW